jgi:hypothetical protein
LFFSQLQKIADFEKKHAIIRRWQKTDSTFQFNWQKVESNRRSQLLNKMMDLERDRQFHIHMKKNQGGE